MREITCIICPRGCIITQAEDGTLSGYSCKRGKDYAERELTNPVRVVTSTVILTCSPRHRRLPVKTNGEISLEDVRAAVKLLEGVTAVSPVKEGDVIYKNILGTGVDFIATRDM